MRVIDLQLILCSRPDSDSLCIYINVPDLRSKTLPVRLFQICNANTGNDKGVKERKTCSYTDPVQLCYFFFSSIKFPAVICIVLRLQSADEPLGVHVQCGQGALADRQGGGAEDKKKLTRFQALVSMGGFTSVSWWDGGQMLRARCRRCQRGGRERHLEDMKRV